MQIGTSYSRPRQVYMSELPALREGLVPVAGPLRITHVVNPFPAPAGSEHDRALRITLAAMARARRLAALTEPDLSVRQVAVVLPGEEPAESAPFDAVLTLERSVLDLRRFKHPRPLPLHRDIIMAADLPDDEILIYTNIDIAPVDGFYGFVAQLFRQGFDAAIINRRDIANAWTGPEDLPLMVTEVGKLHPGADCFAFRAGLRSRFLPWDGCVGIGNGELPLVQNLFVFAEAPCMLLDAHLTFHVGSEWGWVSAKFEDYAIHNTRQAKQVFETIRADPALIARLVSALQLDRDCVGMLNVHRKKLRLPLREMVERRSLRDRLTLRLRRMKRKIRRMMKV